MPFYQVFDCRCEKILTWYCVLGGMDGVCEQRLPGDRHIVCTADNGCPFISVNHVMALHA